MDFLKRTAFSAGGLRLDGKKDIALSSPYLKVDGAVAPTYIDNRGLLMPSDNQGATPQCAAFSMATIIEIANWKRTRVRTSIDPAPIYKRAKDIDGDNNPGTYLDSVFMAAKDLKLISPDAVMRALRTRDDVKFAIREHEACLLGLNISDGWNETSPATGFIGPQNQKLGGHAVVGCWYSDIRGRADNGIGWNNSWGTSWGADGFGRMTWEQFDDQFMYGLVVDL